jgi:hypothetical protein
MTYEQLMTDLSAAGCFPQLRRHGNGSLDVTTVRQIAPDGSRAAPLIRTLLDGQGRWLLTVFGEEFYQVPDPEHVPAATIDMLRAMDDCMKFSPEVIGNHRLIRVNLRNSETDDE